jgi:type 1 glutamine amidotransferase
MRHWFGAFGLCAGLLLLTATPLTPAADKDGPVRVLFILNGHDPAPKAPILEKVLKDIGGFDVKRLESLPKLADVKRADYDVLLFYGGPQATEVQERAIEKFVEDGGGVVALHHSSANNSKAWIRMIGGSFAGHIAGTHKLNVVIADPKHPVTAGVEPFSIVDEEYKHKLADVERKVLAKFRERPEKSDQKANMDIIWTRDIGKGRVVYNALGHGKEAWSNPAWQKITVQSILWAAGKPREVKIPEAK